MPRPSQYFALPSGAAVGVSAAGPLLELLKLVVVTVPSEFTVLTLTPGCANASPVARTKAGSSNATFRILLLIYHFLLKVSPDESGQPVQSCSCSGNAGRKRQTCVTSHTFIPCYPLLVNNKCIPHAFGATVFKPRKGW